MIVTKLDRRFSGYERFTHRVEFSGRVYKIKQWVAVRNWLWEQFGPSAELFAARPEYFQGRQPVWAWDSDKSAIYLTEGAYTMFMLKMDFWEDVKNL